MDSLKPHTSSDAEALASDALELDTRQAPAWQRLLEPMARLGVGHEGHEGHERQDGLDGKNGPLGPGQSAPGSPEASNTLNPWDPHRLKFVQAGLRHRSAPVVFYAVKVGLALGLPIGVWALGHAVGQEPGTLAQATSLLMGSALGLYAAPWWLRRRTAQRQRELFEAFPDAIDLLVVCVEAGLGLDAALERVQQDMRLRSPTLADELALLGSELRLGVARRQALRHLGQRTGVPEIVQFVNMLVQAERFGIGLADALRVHAQDLRLRRQLRAEELAAQIPLKLLFPLIFTLFPSLMVVLLGPAAIGLMRQMLPLVAAR